MRNRTLILLLWTTIAAQAATWHVHIDEASQTTMINDELTLQIDSKGRVRSCTFEGVELVAPKCTWYFSYNANGYHELGATRAFIKTQTDSLIEMVYAQEHSEGIRWTQGYIMRRGVNGVYTYVVAEGTEKEEGLGEARMVYRLDDDRFNYYFIADDRQDTMPRHALMASIEKRVVQDATFYMPDSTIYTKYNYCDYLDNDHFHGIMSDSIGVWAMGVSREYVSGGPLKQDILLHSTSKSTLLLQMLHSGHFGTAAPFYKQGLQKIYGPFFLYVNKGSRADMIADAQREANIQESAWPFTWFKNDLYPIDRAQVTGTIRITNNMPMSPMQVIIADTGNVYNQGTGYIYWAQTDKKGRFTIKNVRQGNYALHVYALGGENTDNLEVPNIVVSEKNVNIGTVEWAPEKHGKLLWQIGEADRKTDGFGGSDLPRDYSNAKHSPLNLTYTIGKSSLSDWYYVQGPKSSWDIHFTLKQLKGDSVYLTAPLAAMSYLPVIKIVVNGTEVGEWVKWECHTDPSVYRSANRSGYYQRMQCVFPASLLHKGENILSLQMPKLRRRGYGGIMWDCIKLEIE
jgi:rhamnogalacturonan endolyase